MVGQNKQSSVQHEVMWCRDSCKSSKLAAMVYLVTRKINSHTIAFVPSQEWYGAADQALTSAGLSCGKLDGLTDEAMLQRYNNGLIKVLLVTDSTLKKSQTNQAKMVVVLAPIDSAVQYRERLDKARGSCQRPLTCVSVLPRDEGSLLRPVMKAVKHPFTQRTVLGDVLIAIEQKIKKQGNSGDCSSGISSEEDEEESDDASEQEDSEDQEKPDSVIEKKTGAKNGLLKRNHKSASGASSNRTKPIDDFFCGIESKISAMDAVSIITSSNKSRQKKLLRKKKKQQQRSESRLSDTESDDDSDEESDEEDERPSKVSRGSGSRQAGPMAKKPKSSTTDALTNVGIKGVKKYRNALTYQEKSLYNKTHGNSKK